jgi:hypothetical protein
LLRLTAITSPEADASHRKGGSFALYAGERRSKRIRDASHAVVLEKVLARERDELILGRVINDFVCCDARGDLRPMLLRVVPEIRDGRSGPRDEDFVDHTERIADVAEELVLGSHSAVMLARVMTVRMDLPHFHVLCVELKHLGCLMVRPQDGMSSAHLSTPSCTTWFRQCATRRGLASLFSNGVASSASM